MRRVIHAAFVAGLLAVGLSLPAQSIAARKQEPPDPGLLEVCKKIIPLGYHQLYKFEASGHLAGTIWANSCSFICGPGAPTPSPDKLGIFDKQGRFLSMFRVYARRHGNDGSFYNARFYTYSPACSTIARRAKRKTGSPEGYIGIGNKTCIKINNLFGREGAAF